METIVKIQNNWKNTRTKYENSKLAKIMKFWNQHQPLSSPLILLASFMSLPITVILLACKQQS